MGLTLCVSGVNPISDSEHKSNIPTAGEEETSRLHSADRKSIF